MLSLRRRPTSSRTVIGRVTPWVIAGVLEDADDLEVDAAPGERHRQRRADVGVEVCGRRRAEDRLVAAHLLRPVAHVELVDVAERLVDAHHEGLVLLDQRHRALHPRHRADAVDLGHLVAHLGGEALDAGDWTRKSLRNSRSTSSSMVALSDERRARRRPRPAARPIISADAVARRTTRVAQRVLAGEVAAGAEQLPKTARHASQEGRPRIGAMTATAITQITAPAPIQAASAPGAPTRPAAMSAAPTQQGDRAEHEPAAAERRLLQREVVAQGGDRRHLGRRGGPGARPRPSSRGCRRRRRRRPSRASSTSDVAGDVEPEAREELRRGRARGRARRGARGSSPAAPSGTPR